MAGAQKQRSGLTSVKIIRYVRAYRDPWAPYCTTRIVKASSACWTEAPHRGAQSDGSVPSTGWPEIAAHSEGLHLPEDESVNCVAQEQSAWWASVHPAPGTRRHPDRYNGWMWRTMQRLAQIGPSNP